MSEVTRLKRLLREATTQAEALSDEQDELRATIAKHEKRIEELESLLDAAARGDPLAVWEPRQ